MTKRSKWIIGVVASVVIVGGAGSWYSASRSKVSYETEAVGRGDVVEEVTVTGSITPAERVELRSEVSGKVAEIKVEEGAEVKAGTVLVEIDSRDLLARIASQRAAVASADARLDELVAGPTQQELALARTAVASAQNKLAAAVVAKTDADTALANAQKNYDNVAAKSVTLLESKRAQLLIDLGEAATAANDAVSRVTGTIFTSDGQLKFTASNSVAENDARNTFGAARAALPVIDQAILSANAAGTAQAALDAQLLVVSSLTAVKRNLDADVVLLNYASSLDASTKATYQASVNAGLNNVNASLQALASSRSNLELQLDLNDADATSAQISLSNASSAANAAGFAVSSAERGLDQAEADLAFKETGSRPEAIAAQRAQVAVQQASLEVLLADLSKRRLTAPIDGVVTDIPVKKGESIQPGTIAATMDAKGNFEIITNISEIDIAKVAVGDAVTITLDAFPRNEVWSGKVARIGQGEKVIESVIFYETTILFDNEDPRLRPGMTANLSIETERRDGALRVPLRAVRQRGDDAYVELLVGGKPEERKIDIGIENSVYAEVLGGLAEGDVVIVSTKTK